MAPRRWQAYQATTNWGLLGRSNPTGSPFLTPMDARAPANFSACAASWRYVSFLARGATGNEMAGASGYLSTLRCRSHQTDSSGRGSIDSETPGGYDFSHGRSRSVIVLSRVALVLRAGAC